MCDPTRQADRLMDIRLRYTINTHLEDLGVTTPAAIGAVASLPAAEAVSLLTRRRWRAGDLAALQAVAARLGLHVVPPDTDLLREKERAHQEAGRRRWASACPRDALAPADCACDRRTPRTAAHAPAALTADFVGAALIG